MIKIKAFKSIIYTKENLSFKIMRQKHSDLIRRSKCITKLSESWQLKDGNITRVRGQPPSIRRPNEVLVKVRAASINPLGKSLKLSMEFKMELRKL